MATITILEPNSGVSKTIKITIEASVIVQELSGEMDFFISLSTSAKDVSGSAIASELIRSLEDGAGGTGKDRKGASLTDGKYQDITEAINDYVAMMVEGKEGEPWTEMSFI